MLRDVKWNNRVESPLNGPHRDYTKNLENAHTFIRNVSKNLLNGMRVYVADSEHLPASLLTMVYKPPLTSKAGTFASSIVLHQEAKEVSCQIQVLFNGLMDKARKYNIPNQKEMF